MNSLISSFSLLTFAYLLQFILSELKGLNLVNSKGVILDENVRSYLKEIEDSLHKTIHDSVDSGLARGFVDMKSHLSEVFGKEVKLIEKDVEHLRERQRENHERYDKYHDEHFRSGRDLLNLIQEQRDSLVNQITNSKDSALKEMGKTINSIQVDVKDLQDRQSRDEGREDGKHGQIALIISIVSVLAAVGSVLTIIIMG